MQRTRTQRVSYLRRSMRAAAAGRYAVLNTSQCRTFDHRSCYRTDRALFTAIADRN
jgi:hypothetical protein